MSFKYATSLALGSDARDHTDQGLRECSCVAGIYACCLRIFVSWVALKRSRTCCEKQIAPYSMLYHTLLGEIAVVLIGVPLAGR